MPEAQAACLLAKVSSSQARTAAPQSGLQARGGFCETRPHHVSFLLSPAARYQNELAGVDTELLAERFYYQALSVAPQIGKWHPDSGLPTQQFSNKKTTLRWQAGRAGFPRSSPCSVPSHFTLVVHSPPRNTCSREMRGPDPRRREAEGTEGKKAPLVPEVSVERGTYTSAVCVAGIVGEGMRLHYRERLGELRGGIEERASQHSVSL